MTAQQPARVVRFGVFEMDAETGDLWNGGHRTRLQDQPRQVLQMLVAHPGEVVTRDALRAALWPNDTFVDFNAGLNVAINKVRHVLRDSATSPRFIETLPRRGYRFIAPVLPVLAEPAVRTATVGRRRAGWMVLAASIVLVIVASAAAVSVWRADRSRPPLRPVPVTTLPGLEYSPAISPDGTQVAFLWAAGDRWDPRSSVYVQPFGAPRPSMLAADEGLPMRPAWSPDGRYLAFLRHPDPGNGALHDIVVVPAGGGAERRLGRVVGERHGLSWSPDGRSLAVIDKVSEKEPDAVFLLSTETGRKERVTSPSNELADCAPIFSPDGRSLAFLREKSRFQADVYVFDLVQRRLIRVIADKGLCNGGLDWTADGSSLIFASSEMGGGGPRLSMVGAAGGPARDLGVEGFEPSTSRRNHRLLVFTRFLIDWNAWRVPGPLGPVADSAPRRLIDSTQLDFCPRYSPDGTKIGFVSQRSGATEIWLADSEGANPRRLTFQDRDDIAKQLAWSPDGREVVFTSPVDGTHDLYVIAAQGGLPERITATAADERFPVFSRDGRSIYFSQRSSGGDQIWRLSRAGGPPLQVTKHGGVEGQESPDGRFLYFVKGPYSAGRSGIWRIALRDGQEEKIVEHGDMGRWDVYDRGVCYLNVGRDQSATVECMDVATRSVRRLATFEKQPLPAGFSVSPDGQWILLTRVDRNESDLMMVENVRE